MTSTTTVQKKELSQEARAYLWSPEVFDGLERLVTEAGGGEDEVSKLHSDVIELCEGSRTEEELIETIKKLLGLERMKAMTLLDEIVSILLAGKIGKPAASSVPLIPSDSGTKPLGAVVQQDDHAQDEQDLAAIKEKHAAVLTSAAPVDVESIVKTICENPAFQFSDVLLKDRCGKLVESRVREVRTAEQTRSQLERSVDAGGLGVTGRRLADMLSMIEGEVTRYQEASMVKQEQEKGAAKEARQKKVIEKQDVAKQEEAQLAKRYEQLTGQVRNAIEQSKVPAVPKRPRVQAQASMQEIAFEKRLTGPVEELRMLSLLDFRRLSSDPKQAATKVKDKVGLLEEQGYDKKIEGIKAWRESPLNKLYMGVTRDAVLKGMPVVQLLSERRAAKEETLTDEELKMMMELNAELRF